MSSPRNLYDALNVAQNAEPVVIEAAYRALIKKYHPDNGDPASVQSARAAEINRAFAVLKDPAKRAAYDHLEWKRQQAFRNLAAPYSLPRQPVARWSGWAVAVVLGLVLAGFAMLPKKAASSAGGQGIATAAVHSGTQPPHDDLWLPDSDSAAEIRRQALAATAGSDGVAAPARPIARSFAPAGSRVDGQHRRREGRPQGNNARAAGADADFFEREGYIY